MIMCYTRDAVLEDLCTLLSETDLNEEGEHGQISQLLVPIIHQLATSQTVKVAYAPSLAHLRAYLAMLGHDPSMASQTRHQSSGRSTPLLAIHGLFHLHRTTSEYSAQGLSRTLAVAAEAATATGRRLVIAESLRKIEGEELVDASDSVDTVMRDPWKDEVPLLNGALRFGTEDRVWAGRTVEAARVVGRWCKAIHEENEMDT